MKWFLAILVAAMFAAAGIGVFAAATWPSHAVNQAVPAQAPPMNGDGFFPQANYPLPQPYQGPPLPPDAFDFAPYTRGPATPQFWK